MKRLSLMATAVAGLLFFAIALSTQPVQAGTGIVLVDIPKVFEQHQRFRDRMGEVQQDVQKFGTYLSGRRQQLMTRQSDIQKQQAGSVPRKQMETQLTKEAADLEVQRQLEVRNVREREARIYLEAYNEVVREVREVAARHGATLVLRYSSVKIDGNNRESVIMGVNRPVVYQNGLDITQQVIERLNRSLPPANIGTGFVPPPGPRR